MTGEDPTDTNPEIDPTDVTPTGTDPTNADIDINPTDVTAIGADPTDAVPGAWDAFADDVAVTAEEYRDDGWEVIELHPSAVAPVPEPTDEESDGEPSAADRVGFDVFVPDGEFGRVNVLLSDEFAPTEYEIYRAAADGFTFALVVEREEETRRAVFVPLYYRTAAAERAESIARERETLTVYLQPLLADLEITFSHDDPDRFFGPLEE